MNKIIIALLSLFLTGSIFYSCSLLNSLQEAKSQGFICSKYTDIPQMQKSTVVDMVRNYYQHQHNAIRNNNTIVNLPPNYNIDARAVFFNLDTLKRLIYFVEKSAENFSAKDKSNLGLNIYFASYPKVYMKKHYGIDYTNRHTLVFVPSIFDDNRNTPRDFNPLYAINNPSNSPKYLTKEDFSNSNLSSAMVAIGAVAKLSSSGSNNNTTAQNNGTSVPPPPTGNDLLDVAQ